VSANGANVVHTTNTIGNYLNCAFLEFGGSQQLDLRFVSQAGSASTWALWNGYPGTNNGYLVLQRNGVFQGAYSPTGLWQWGGTAAAPAAYINQAGQMNLQGAFYAGNTAGADQISCGLRMGSGVPSNAVGNNGDFYLRSDTPGTANQRLYVRSAGAYVGIA
jgi:hypothetical protein